MKNNLKISLIQSNLFWEDVDKNLSHFEGLISEISNTDIILLPETFNTSFSIKATHLAEKMDGKTVNWMKKISKQKKCAIAGSLMVIAKGKVYNRLVWISKKGDINTYDKHHLFKEEKSIEKGEGRLLVEIEGWKICPLICYDLRFPVFSRNDIGYDILIYVANWPVKRIDAWDTLLRARSIENQCYTIGLNRIGKDGNGIFCNGHSAVFDAFGAQILSSTENKEEVLQIEIYLDDMKTKRKKMNFLQDRDDFTIH
ncbi:MAG: nitrilase family protein [Flavobacteriales bacterium]|jgi:omega-amidase|nr:nitrilase family protein [Flavobacteriales bacterium]